MSYTFMRFPDGKAKAVTFSYDDGVKTDIRLSEVLNRYGIKCTFNICRALSREDAGKNKLSVEDIKEYILKNSHEIAVHGYEHKAPGNCRDTEIIKDVLACREELEQGFGEIIRGMAYPDCGITNVSNDRYRQIKALLKSLDIVYARTLGDDNNDFSLPDDFYAWMPTAHHENSSIFSWIDEFVSVCPDELYWAHRQPRLFYLWGHSFEFEANNNWHRLEEICEKLGKKSDIWYATNIEIYEYVKAYDELIFSSSRSIVYNPTLKDIWFNKDGNTYCVKAGEKLKL